MTTIRTTNVPPRQAIERLLADVSALKGEVEQIQDGYQDSYRSAQGAGQNIQSSQWPLRRAQSDTPQTNVSFEGRQIEQYLSQAERLLRDNDFRLGRLDGASSHADPAFRKAQSDLQQLVAGSGAYPGASYALQQAQVYLQGAGDDHQSADSQAGWGRTHGNSVERELQWADMNVRNICYDRPGVDVSYDARQAGMRVDRAQWEMRDGESNLFQAQALEDRSAQNLSQVEAQLRQALAGL